MNEAWIRLMRGNASFENRAYFFAAAAQAMRRVLVDYAREKNARKRGGDARRVTLAEGGEEPAHPVVDLLAPDQALSALSAKNERLGRVAELRYFAGLSVDEVAGLLELSEATVRRDWAYAKAWLFDYMSR